jgi:hypothetical protein
MSAAFGWGSLERHLGIHGSEVSDDLRLAYLLRVDSGRDGPDAAREFCRAHAAPAHGTTS